MASSLKRKILWFFDNVALEMTQEDFELIELAEFDENGELLFNLVSSSKNREIYQKYWKRLLR